MIEINLKSVVLLFISSLSLTSHAQSISPKDLFQINNYWQMNIDRYDHNACDYLKTVDSHWMLRSDPDRANNGLSIYFGYERDSKWYKDGQLRLALMNDPASHLGKAIIYRFIDEDLWNKYNYQMTLMNAEQISNQQILGGQQKVYNINGIIVYLTNYPPGINGDERTYDVMITNKQ